jgi:hypothetical protein
MVARVGMAGELLVSLVHTGVEAESNLGKYG